MTGIDPDVSKAIVRVLQECGKKPLGVRPLATYANAELRVAASADDIQRHVLDLEQRGYAERRANTFNPAVIEWIITDAGMNL